MLISRFDISETEKPSHSTQILSAMTCTSSSRGVGSLCAHVTQHDGSTVGLAARAAYPKLQSLVREFRDRGVQLTTGTDLTNPWVIPGESLHQEFELLANAGFSPKEILKMTGENAARALRRSDVDVIEPGRRADLVLLRADPQADIRNTQQIAWVMMGGQVVSQGPAARPGQASGPSSLR